MHQIKRRKRDEKRRRQAELRELIPLDHAETVIVTSFAVADGKCVRGETWEEPF